MHHRYALSCELYYWMSCPVQASRAISSSCGAEPFRHPPAMASVEENLCDICQAPFLVGDVVLDMTCAHIFHELCITTYLRRPSTTTWVSQNTITKHIWANKTQLQCPICCTQDDFGFVKEEDSSSEDESTIRKRWFGDYEQKLYKNIHTVDEEKARKMYLKPKSRAKPERWEGQNEMGERILFSSYTRASGDYSWMKSSAATGSSQDPAFVHAQPVRASYELSWMQSSDATVAP